MEDLIGKLKLRPDLKGISDTLQSILKEEARLREEFYNTINEDDKAEFINGEVIMHSPVKLEHLECGRLLMNLLLNYTLNFDLGEVYQEKMMVQLSRNSYEPDIAFFKKERAQKFAPEQMLFPSPDFIAEIISPSTEKNDRGIKFDDYALHNVAEYWIIDPIGKSIEQYLLISGAYTLEFKGKNGLIASRIIPGFTINANAIFSKPENIKALQQLLK